MTRQRPLVPVFTPWPYRPGTLNRNVYLASLGHLSSKTNRVRARFAFPAVGLVVAGVGTYRAGTQTRLPVKAGTWLSVYPGTEFDYGPDGTWEEYYVGFAGPGAAALTGGLIPTGGPLRELARVTPAVSAFKEIIRTWNRNGPGDADLACLLAQRLLLDVFVGAEARTTPHLDVIESVMRECRARLHEPLDFERLAARHRISYSLLRRRLCERTGFSPAKYLTRLRCEAACELLATTSLAVKEIARKVGVPDPYTFSRTFQRTTGRYPSAYRASRLHYGSETEHRT